LFLLNWAKTITSIQRIRRMSMRLFRNEAVAAMTDLDWGRPISAMPPAWWWLSAFFAALALGIGTFLATATIVRKEPAMGVLSLSDGELRVVPARVGIVRQVYVQEGDLVEEGAPLALISTEQELAGGAVVDARVMKAIDDEQAMLMAQLDALDRASPLGERAMAERLQGIENQIDDLRHGMPGREERVALAKQALDAGQTLLDKGVTTATDMRQRRSDFLAQQQSLWELKTQIAQLSGQAAETEASLAKLPSDAAQTRASIQQQMVALEEKRAQADAQHGYVLNAAVAGKVTALQAAPGQPADPTKPLMTLIPAESRLEAQIYVPSRAIGFIAPSQRVRLLYDAFPHERFGAAYGRVLQISATVLKPEEVADAVPVKEPVYPVTVTLDRASITAYGKDIPLRSGMALTADILLEERSILDLLLDPLLAARGRILGDI
jgi:membrane fusion protein